VAYLASDVHEGSLMHDLTPPSPYLRNARRDMAMTCRPRIQHFQGPRGFLLLAALGACMADRSVDPTADENCPEFRRRLSLAAAWDAAWEVV
jgi:hypothetical protein